MKLAIKLIPDLKMKSHNHVATLIKTKRSEHPKRYSQDELSALLGFKCNTLIARVEDAQKHVPFKVMPKITKILDIKQDDFIKAALKDHEESLDKFFETNFKKEILYM